MQYIFGMFTLFLILLGNITVSVVSTQYYLQTIEVREILKSNNDHVLVDGAVVNEAMWGDSAGNLYISEVSWSKSCKVRKIDAVGRVTIMIGPEAMDGTCFSGLYGDPTGDIIYLSQEYKQAIWRHNISSNITVQIAGNGNQYDPSNNKGSALSSPMNPTSLFLSSTGMLYFCDTDRHLVRVINTKDQIVNTFAGNPEETSIVENVPATSVWLHRPTGVWGDSLGFIFIADRSSNRVRRVNSAGIIATFAGNGRYAGEWIYMSFPNPNVEKSELGDNGPATLASLEYPYDVKGDKEGNIFIVEWTRCRIRMVSLDIITTNMGSDTCRYATYSAQSNVVDTLWSLWVVNKETLYFSEAGRLTLATIKQSEEEEEEEEYT